MKKSIILLAAAMLSFSSCSDFLTEEPVMTQSNELTLSTFTGLDNATAALYNRFQSYYWYGGSHVLTAELSGGNARNPISYPGSGRYRYQTNWAYNENSTSSIWYYAYYTIAAANNVLNNLEGKESTEVSAQDIANIRAEALTIRAFCHFDLVRTYAQPYTYGNPEENLGVPYIFVTEMGQPARDNVKTVYDNIVTDLLEAEGLMADNYQRAGVTDAAASITKPVIQALLSRVYLYMGNYQGAADYATKVINCGKYSLMSGDNYLGMFTQVTATDGGETIFEMFSFKGNTYWDGSGWEQMSYITSTGDRGSADVCASSDLIDLFSDASDIRLQLYSLENNTDWFCLKYAGKTGSSVPCENNTPLIRLSEMYLNRAEALANGATIAGVSADQDLQTLCEHRGVTAPAATVTNILTERRKELAFEGHILYDLKRTGNGVVRTDGAGVDVPFPDNRWAFPIPKSECDANPNMVQNP